MHDLHIGDFYKDAAHILLLLYRRFPTKTTLYIEDICGPDTIDEFGLHSPRHVACFSAAIWLAEEVFFRFSTPIRQEALEEAVLSLDALIFLTGTTDPGLQLPTRILQLESIVSKKDSTELGNFFLSQFVVFASRQLRAPD